MDTTFPIFRLSGKQPVCNAILKISHYGRRILSVTALITLGDISSYPGLLFDTKSLTILFISSSLIGFINIALLISFFINSRWLPSICGIFLARVDPMLVKYSWNLFAIWNLSFKIKSSDLISLILSVGELWLRLITFFIYCHVF